MRGLSGGGLLWVALAGIASSGCGSTPALVEPAAPGGTLEVKVLPGPWVQFDGERMPEDEFVLRMRLCLRAFGWEREGKPGLRVTAAQGLSHTRITGFLRVIEDLGRWGLEVLVFEEG